MGRRHSTSGQPENRAVRPSHRNSRRHRCFTDQFRGTAFCLALNMVDIARPSQAKKKRIRRILYVTAGVVAIGGISLGVSKLKPAAPTVDRAVVWIDTVKRGSMLRQVRGSGVLDPRRHPLDPRADAGTRRTHRSLRAGRAGHARQRHPRVVEPRASRTRSGTRSSLTSRRRPRFTNREGGACREHLRRRKRPRSNIETQYKQADARAPGQRALLEENG